MAHLTEVDPRTQPPSAERAMARLARIARADTYFGGARALVLLKRLSRSVAADYDHVVSDVYGRSDYTVAGHGFYECPECGSAHYGEDAAWECCQVEWEPWMAEGFDCTA